MSRLICIYAVCKSILLSPVAVKELSPLTVLLFIVPSCVVVLCGRIVWLNRDALSDALEGLYTVILVFARYLCLLSPAFSKKNGGTLFWVFRGAWCVVRGAWCVPRGAWCVVPSF